MPLQIPVTGLASNDPVPGTYIEINFAVGPVGGFSGNYNILLIGNRLSTGTATLDTVVYGPNSNPPLSSEQDAITLFGAGSELHRLYRKANLTATTAIQIFAIAATETSGAGVAASTGTITFATTAAGSGSFRIFVGDDFVDVSVASGDTAIVIAGNAATAINNKVNWGVTAANSGTAVVTLTSKQKGTRTNKIRYSAVQVTGGSGVATTVTPGSSTYMTGGLAGATPESWTTVLSTINPIRYYYIVPADDSSTSMSTNLSALMTQVTTQALPLTGIRQVVVTGSIDTAANSQTLGQAINNPRCSLVWSRDNEFTPGELAATVAGARALTETTVDKAYNFDFYPTAPTQVGTWTLQAPKLQSSWPSRTDFKNALNSGVTPIGVFQNGATYMVKSITTRCLNGSNFDYRTRSTHQPSTLDRYADDLVARSGARFQAKKLMADPAVGATLPDPSVVTPRIVLAMVNQLTSEYEESAWFPLPPAGQPDPITTNTVVIIDSTNPNRVSARIPALPIFLLDQATFSVNDVTPG